jgi:hypothetical protein
VPPKQKRQPVAAVLGISLASRILRLASGFKGQIGL